jgi:hypothetical protein
LPSRKSSNHINIYTRNFESMLVMARGPSKLTLLQDFVIPHHVVDEANIIPRQCYDQETGMFCTSPTVYTILTLPSPSPILPRYRISVPPNSSSKLHTPSTQTQSPPLSTKKSSNKARTSIPTLNSQSAPQSSWEFPSSYPHSKKVLQPKSS